MTKSQGLSTVLKVCKHSNNLKVTFSNSRCWNCTTQCFSLNNWQVGQRTKAHYKDDKGLILNDTVGLFESTVSGQIKKWYSDFPLATHTYMKTNTISNFVRTVYIFDKLIFWIQIWGREFKEENSMFIDCDLTEFLFKIFHLIIDFELKQPCTQIRKWTVLKL